MTLTLALICFIVGLLIGVVGIGGVLLVPALTFVAGLRVHEAVPACMLSFLAAGIVAAVVYARHGSIRWDMAAWLCAGAVPAALLGALALASIPALLVMSLVALLMILAGLDALLKSWRGLPPAEMGQVFNRWQFVAIGFVTGFGSAITGTGGPLILVPILIYLGMPALIAVGLSQALQVPIAGFASLGNWMTGNLNIELSLLIAAVMVLGVFVGATLVHRLPTEPLRKLIAYFLVLVGIGICVRLALTYSSLQ